MIEYPCSVCTFECHEKASIYCTKCQKWVHKECAEISDSEIESWSLKSLYYFCERCSFTKTGYDARAALTRLRNALFAKKGKSLKNVAQSEQKLLKAHNVSIPTTSSVTYNNCEIDEIAMFILDFFHPAMKSKNKPLKTHRDGNCLYRAVSKSLTGSEQYHELLRLRTALELILNHDFYSEDFIKDYRIPCSDQSKLVQDALVINSFSEMGHFYALSAAIGRPIKSYYPPQPEPEYTSEPMTRRVVGRNVKNQETDLCVMWSSIYAPDAGSVNCLFNHIVSLVPTSSHQVNLNIDESTEILEESYNDSFSDTFMPDVTVTEVESIPGDNMVPVINLNSEPKHSTPDLTAKQRSVEKNPIIDSTNCSSNIRPGSTESQLQCELLNGFMDTREAVQCLTKNRFGLHQIPTGLKQNKYFIINNEKNLSRRTNKKQSNFSDDCGVWESVSGSTPKTYYYEDTFGNLSVIFLRNGLFCKVKRVQKKTEYVAMVPQPLANEVILVHRYYAHLKLDRTYRKKVTWLGDSDKQSKLAVAEYIGIYPGLSYHGNSKERSEYLRVPGHVMDEVSDMLSQYQKLLIVYSNLTDKYDELSCPSNIQMIRDKKKYQKSKSGNENLTGIKKNAADQFRILDNWVSENHPFVRASLRCNGKTPSVVLYTDEQMLDIKNLCCRGHTILGIDKTFNLCDVHVTVTCYKQLSVIRHKTGDHPLFIGPMYMHDSSDYESYVQFFDHLKMKLVDSPFDTLVFGSDDERAMVKAIVSAFPEATHVH